MNHTADLLNKPPITFWARPISITGQRLSPQSFPRASARKAYVNWLRGARRGVWYVSQWETSGA